MNMNSNLKFKVRKFELHLTTLNTRIENAQRVKKINAQAALKNRGVKTRTNHASSTVHNTVNGKINGFHKFTILIQPYRYWPDITEYQLTVKATTSKLLTCRHEVPAVLNKCLAMM